MVKSRVKIPWFESAAIPECLLCPNSEEIFFKRQFISGLKNKGMWKAKY